MLPRALALALLIACTATAWCQDSYNVRHERQHATTVIDDVAARAMCDALMGDGSGEVDMVDWRHRIDDEDSRLVAPGGALVGVVHNVQTRVLDHTIVAIVVWGDPGSTRTTVLRYNAPDYQQQAAGSCAVVDSGQRFGGLQAGGSGGTTQVTANGGAGGQGGTASNNINIQIVAQGGAGGAGGQGGNASSTATGGAGGNSNSSSSSSSNSNSTATGGNASATGGDATATGGNNTSTGGGSNGGGSGQGCGGGDRPHHPHNPGCGGGDGHNKDDSGKGNGGEQGHGGHNKGGNGHH